LRTIARNKIRDHFSSQAAQPVALGGTDAKQRWLEIADDESEVIAQPGPLGDLCRRALESIRAEFEDRTWRAFWLAAVDQQPSMDIAQQLGMSSSAVRQAKCRVLRRLRQEIGDVE
jgi:RNA polymerase sigma-70 factor (ECF subfamily)